MGENTPPIQKWAFTKAPSNAPWIASLSEIARRSKGATLDPKLGCVAHEVARAYARLESIGDARFRTHLALHCGLSSASVNVQYAKGSAPPQLSDVKLWAGVSQADLSKSVDWLVKAGAVRLGIGLAREGSKVAWVIVGQNDSITLESVTPEPDASHLVHLKGSSRVPLEQLRVLINSGRYDAKDCNLAIDKNQFFATCPMAPEDEGAWFEVLEAADDRLLFRIVARGQARRTPLGLSYARPDEGNGAVTSFAEGVALELNRARKSSGRALLTLSEPQSQVVGEFLPHIAITTVNLNSKRETDLTLGLLAGWKLKAPVRAGQSYVYSAATQSPAAWIEECLEFPMARSILLDKDSRILSVAGMPWGAHGTMGIVTTHSLYGKNDDHKADAALALMRLYKARVGAEMPPFKVAPPTPELHEAALAIRDQGVSPEGALDYAATSLAQRLTEGRVRALHVEAYTFDSLQFPAELLLLHQATVRVMVTHYHPDHGAWGQMSLLMLVETEG